MSRATLTERERELVERGKRRSFPVSTDADVRDCRALVKKTLLKQVNQYTVLTDRGPVSVTDFKTTNAGIRASKGETPHPLSERAKERKAWAAETKADTAAGVRCCWPGCREVSTEGHHAEKARTRNNTRENRRPLCGPHHREAESNPTLAKKFGISVSSLGTITPSPDGTPWSERAVAS